MKQKVEAEYQAWLKEVESKLDDTGKQAWQSLTANEQVAQELFGGHLREADYYRKLNDVAEQKRAAEAAQAELAAKEAALDRDVAVVDEWFKREQPKNQRLIAEREALAQQLKATRDKLAEYGLEDNLPEVPKVEANGRGVTEDSLREEVAALKRAWTQYDRALPKILADYGDVLTKLHKDGFDVNPRQIIDYTTTKGVELTQAYEALTADQRKKREDEAHAKEIEKAKEEARREALSKLPSAGGALRPQGPTVNEMLKNAADYSDPQKRVSLAVQDYLNGVGRT